VSVQVRCLRQFHEGAQVFTLEKALVLPDVPTMGTRVDLRAEGVEEALTVVGVTMRATSDGPGIRPPNVDVVLHWEPFATVEAARSAGWRNQQTSPESPRRSDPWKTSTACRRCLLQACARCQAAFW